jgi:hypothetical protein
MMGVRCELYPWYFEEKVRTDRADQNELHHRDLRNLREKT